MMMTSGGLNSTLTVRLAKADLEALHNLRSAWGVSQADAIRLLVRDAAKRVAAGQARPPVLEAPATPGQNGGMSDERANLGN
jgi:hypothetical protein